MQPRSAPGLKPRSGGSGGRGIFSSSIHLGFFQRRCPLDSLVMVKVDQSKADQGWNNGIEQQSESTQWVIHSPIPPIRPRHRADTSPTILRTCRTWEKTQRDAKRLPSCLSNRAPTWVCVSVCGARKRRTWKGLENTKTNPSLFRPLLSGKPCRIALYV